MPDLPDLIASLASGVAQIVLESDRVAVGGGSAFLVDGERLVTADHVLRPVGYDTARIRFDTDAPDGGFRVSRTDLLNAVAAASPEEDLDYAVVSLTEGDLAGRHHFGIDRDTAVPPGSQVLLMGFPYRQSHLTSHVAYVSAAYKERRARVLQLDGSVNPAHSGGPVVDPNSGAVVGYVVRAHTGLADDFDDLVRALEDNVEVLSPSGPGRIVIGGIDPRAAFRATMISMRQLALNLRRSANVGIGFAFSARDLPN